ncbi:MAG: hypothetical protein JWP29_1956 [Rhodoferax sp.]|nr:hypothetical protein [Rhodoferax sp.]
MGEAAEDILDGTVCEGCGVFFDDILNNSPAPGFPRKCDQCAPGQTHQHKRRQPNSLAVACPGCGRSFNHKGDMRAHRRAKSH